MANSVMVIGGGIAGVQASLELADMGYKVYLVEKTGAIGGVMSALDKTFPTNDCSMCILSPKLVECGRHPNIEIITFADLVEVNGKEGEFEVKIKKKARYVDMEKCIACGICAEKCPRKVPDEYNFGLSQRRAIYIKYPQAVPLKYAIDRESCIFFQKGRCKACEKFCRAGAINFNDSDKILNLKVGSIILAPGFQTFDPKIFDTYNYSHLNVITSIEFERILSASGPTQGELIRPSDKKRPKKIAWIQCVGSRNINLSDNSYCSSVCCMYAIKQAIIAKEHIRDSLDTAIFFMDIRASGKGFEQYYERAKREHGVRFIRCRVHSVDPIPDSDDLLIRYVTDEGSICEEKFDMVVLSVGIEPIKEIRNLADKLGIDLNKYGFAKTSSFSPIRSNKKGIFVCGAFQEPKDIPQSVTEALASAAEASLFAEPAKEEIKEVTERDVSKEEPRIGVFVCHCGVNIGSVVDVPKVTEYAKKLPYVVYAEDNLFTCSQDSQEKIKEAIKKYRLNRIVVASCSPRTHEKLFQDTIKEAGLNKYLFEMANIRDQDSWVHQNEPDKATQKAKDLVRMAVAKVALQEPLKETAVSVTKAALVIGGGVAGMEAALTIADHGYQVFLIEKERFLGGHARDLLESWDGMEVNKYLDELIRKVEDHDLIKVYLNAKIKEVNGFVGNFSTKVEVDGKEEEIKHGVTVIATGGRPYIPNEYSYGKSDRIYLLLELDKAIRERKKDVIQAKSAVFIQCVGSRVDKRPYCSKVCCTHSIKNALLLKKLNPDMDVFILYRDIRTYGLREDLYKEARKEGIIFIRYDLERRPKVRVSGNDLEVEVIDHILGRRVVLKPDILILASAILPNDNEELAKLFKIPLDSDGFFLEAHMKLRPVDFATDGIFVAGLCHYPKPIEETITQAKAASCRAINILSKDTILTSGIVARINKERCSGCRFCEKCCPFGAIQYLADEGYCQINEVLCKGCGTCSANCPSEAISLMGFKPQQLYRQIDSALEEEYAREAI